MVQRWRKYNEKRVGDDISIVTMCDQRDVSTLETVTVCLAILPLRKLKERVVLCIKHTLK